MSKLTSFSQTLMLSLLLAQVVQAQEPPAFSIEDLEAQAVQEAQQGGYWEGYQQQMKSAFAQVQAFEQKQARTALKAEAWGRFLSAFAEDNPYSLEDEDLRTQAQERFESWDGGSENASGAPAAPSSAQPSVAAAASAAEPAAETTASGLGAEWLEPNTGLTFVRIPGGTFEMGDVSKSGGPQERPSRQVTLGDYWLSTTEVTQAQWEKIMEQEAKVMAPVFRGPDLPVMLVSWEDTQVFMQRLQESHQGQHAFRLPTEAEWEYACREGGKSVRYGTGKDRLTQQEAQYGGKMKTSPVGSFAPNALGLYDMTGNLWEWTYDGITSGWGYKMVLDRTDNPLIEDFPGMRYGRGGSWMTKDGRTSLLRCTGRRQFGAKDPSTTGGFRVAIPGPESARP